MLIGNKERAVKIFRILIRSFERKELIWFNLDLLPQEKFLPEKLRKNPLRHRWFLWFSALLMRGGINDDTVFKALKGIYEEEPGIFNPQKVTDSYSEQDIRRFLFKHRLNYKGDEISRFWKKNALGLRDYGWDPLKIFEGAKSYREIWQRIIKDGKKKKFFGLRKKIISLLINWYEEAGFIELLYGPPPIDFHVGRILLNTRIIEGLEGFGEKYAIRYEKVRDVAIPFLEEICQEQKFYTPSLNAALWILSRKGCRKQPKYCHLCPIEEYCKFFTPAKYYYGRIRKSDGYRTKGGKFAIIPREQKQLHFKF